MNTNPGVKKILCFGDSLTWGQAPKIMERYSPKQRWTGVLQNLLGDDYEIIEEGLGGRTTDLDDPKDPERNGFRYFKPCLISKLPLDIIIILLGSNDLKNKFNRNVPQIADALKKYVNYTNQFTKTKIVIISPPIVDQKSVPEEWDFKDAENRSKEFAKHYSELATQTSCLFFDCARIVKSSSLDGVHLDESENIKLANELYKFITAL